MTHEQIAGCKVLQEAYIKAASQYGELVPIERVESEMKIIKKDRSFVDVIIELSTALDIMFMMELVMKPRWATKQKAYYIYERYYTHIRLKKRLVDDNQAKEQ